MIYVWHLASGLLCVPFWGGRNRHILDWKEDFGYQKCRRQSQQEQLYEAKLQMEIRGSLQNSSSSRAFKAICACDKAKEPCPFWFEVPSGISTVTLLRWSVLPQLHKESRCRAKHAPMPTIRIWSPRLTMIQALFLKCLKCLSKPLGCVNHCMTRPWFASLEFVLRDGQSQCGKEEFAFYNPSRTVPRLPYWTSESPQPP